MADNIVLCREHLRKEHQDLHALVEDFITEIEGAAGWGQFTDIKHDDREMLQKVEEAFQTWLNP